jgi:ABC-type lipoprotein release transport system permease subunit
MGRRSAGVTTRSGEAAPWGGLFLCARAGWRARWPSLVVLIGVVAMTVAAVVALLTAAERSETAFERLRSATRASDAIVMETSDGPTDFEVPIADVAAVDGVEGATAQAELFVRPAGTDLFPDYNLWAGAPLQAPTVDSLDTPLIAKGRAVDPSRTDEVVVSEKLAAKLGIGVGDSIMLESMTSDWVDVAFEGGDPGPPDGPKVPVRVVGLSRTPGDFGRMEGILLLSPAFVERFGGQLRVYVGVHARLSDDARRKAENGGLPGLAENLEVRPSPFGDVDATDGGLGTIATALRLVALVASLAGAVVTALTLARLTRTALRDRPTLAALGLTTRDFVGAAVLMFAPWLLVGIGLGLLAGVLQSGQAMVGLARRIDPASGSAVADVGVVVGTAAVAVVVGMLMVTVAARRDAAVAKRSARPLPVPVRVRRPLSIVLGGWNARFGERARGGRTSRSAIVISAVGVAGVVAALMVSASISRLQTDGSLNGQGEGRVIDSGESVEVYDRAMPRLEQDDRVEMLAGIHVTFGISSDGDDDMAALAYDVKRGDLGAAILKGRIAQQPDEVAVGPTTLDRLGKEVGDTVELRGEHSTADYRIVGVTLFPEGDFAHDEGVALTVSGADRIIGNTHDNAVVHSVVFDWADDIDAEVADEQLAADGMRVMTNEDALLPASVSNLDQVEALPRFLAALLVLLSVVAIGHALSMSVTLHRPEMGTLRALGMTARASACIVATQALCIVVLALAIGLPLGLAIGTQVWTPLATRAHVVVRAVAPGSLIAGYVLAVAIASAALTVLPARRTFRLRPAEALRTG